MKNIVLIGMPGCGKSTLGVLLAKALAMDFVDTDLVLQRQSGKPLQALVDELGTAGFSRAEEACVLRMDIQGAVVATGGSVALEEEAMAHLSQNGTVVFVRLPYATIEKRLQNMRTRGIAMEKGQTLRDLYNLRQPYYERWADITVDPDGQDVEQTVALLVRALQNRH